jgi:pimeloyl-ACP methyl ester carboxylesterase
MHRMLPLLLALLLVAGMAPPVITTATPPLATGLASMEWLRCGDPSATRPPVVFIHGTFHGAWCWSEHWMPRFAAAGLECHALSLRGTSGSPCDSKSVKIAEHVADLTSFVEDVLPADSLPPIFVGHSFGGATVLKYLEAGGRASGAVLLCSVPPSGNGPMTLRYLRRSLKRAWLITAGIALKRCVKDAAVARELFFDETMADAALASYMPRFAADSRVGLDVRDFAKNAPSTRADNKGKADWLPRAPPALVLGAARDCVVDREGVEETARFIGTAAEFVPLAHDVMLVDGWEAPADRIIGWIEALGAID